MTQWHMKSRKKKSGGTRKSLRRSDKRLAWRGGNPAETTIAAEKDAIVRNLEKGLGNTSKVKVKAEKFVLAANPSTKKHEKLEILAVVENKADRQFARRNIITKGAVLKAKHGAKEVFVRVSSRPGQSGIVSGVILDGFTPEKEIKKQESSKKAEKKHKAKEKAPEATESTGKPAKEASAEA